MYFPRLAVVAAAFALVAADQPEKRQIDSIIGSITSGAGSVFSVATSGAASVATNVATHVTSVGGSLYTVVTDGAGNAYTLATGAGGKVTSFGGSIYTVATGSIPTTTGQSAAAPTWHGPISMPMLAALGAIVGGIALGVVAV